MTSSSSSYTALSHPRPETGLPYNDSLRRLKDGILLEGRLSGVDLQRCLLMIGVPSQDCPTPEQLLQRLGISSLGQSTPLLDTTPSNTLERKNKKRFAALRKVHKPKIFRSKGDKISDCQDSAEFVITQLLHSCLLLLSLEATHQTSPHTPLSPQLPAPSFSLLEAPAPEEGKRKLAHTQSELAWSERDREGARPDTCVDADHLRRELGEVKRSRDDMEYRYIETRDRCSLDPKDPQLSQPDPASLSHRATQEKEFLNAEIFQLRQENDALQRSLHNTEAYTSHLESKYDELSVRLGSYQLKLTNALDANHDMSIQMAKSSTLANMATSAHPPHHLSERSPHTHHSQGGSGNQRFNTTPAQRKQEDIVTQDPANKKGSNQSLHKVAAPGSQSKSAVNNLNERSSSDRVFEYVQNLQQQQKEHHKEQTRNQREEPLEEKSRSQRSDNLKSESSEGNLVSLPGMYKYESRGGSNPMVLGSEIDPSIFPLSMSPDLKKQMILALNQCVSVQDLIQTIFTFGYTPSTESNDVLKGENQYLVSQVERLRAENQCVSHSLKESKDLADELYITAKQYECNNELLTRAVHYADQGLQVYCALLCLYDNEHSIISINQRLAGHEPLDYGLFISSQAIADLLVGSEQSLDLTMKRLYETRQKIEQNIRTVIGNYDILPDVQRYLPIPLSHSSSHNRSGHRSKRRSLGSSSPGNSSRNEPVSKESSVTSGHGSMLSLSSHNESTDNELSPDDIKRMRHYIEVFHRLKKKVCNQMVQTNGALFDHRSKFEFKVKSPSVRKDTTLAEQWLDLETAIHMQEISAVKEEKAKLQSQAYLLEQEMRIIELKLCAAKDQEAAYKQYIDLLKHEAYEQDRKRKKAQKELKALKEQKTDLSHSASTQDQTMQQMLELRETVEQRERWLREKYHELTNTFDSYISRTQDRNEQLLSFVRDLKKANVALVSAYEKAKRKSQHLHKKLLNYVTQRDLDLPDSNKDIEPTLLQTPVNKFTQL